MNINIRRVEETQMVSVCKRNIQGRYNSVRHLQRQYPELQPLRVVSIVTSSVPISLENTNSGYTPKSKIFAPRLKVINHVPALSSHNSVTVNSVGVNTKNTKNKKRKKQGKKQEKTRHSFADACMILQNKFLLRGMSSY